MKIESLIILKIFCVSFLHTQIAAEQNVVLHPKSKSGGPQLTVTDCYILEKTSINVDNSRCIFDIMNYDGNLGSITFTINGTFNENNIFDLVYRTTPPSSETKTSVYLVLKGNQTLDYETKSSYNFDVQVKGGTENVPVTVKVYKVPIWTIIPSVLEIYEEENTTFSVSAAVGDGHPDTDINYFLAETTVDVNSTVDGNTMHIFVPPIDREAHSSVVLDVRAFYADSLYGTAYGQIILLVNDIDDNLPIIDYDKNKTLEITVPQNSSNVVVSNLKISDRDQAANAAFSIILKTPEKLKSAFGVSPSAGTGSVNCEITIDAKKLDYDDSMWSTFQLELQAQGVKNTTAQDSLSMTVTLFKQKGSGSGTVGTSSAIIFSVLVLCWRYLHFSV